MNDILYEIIFYEENDNPVFVKSFIFESSRDIFFEKFKKCDTWVNVGCNISIDFSKIKRFIKHDNYGKESSI